MKFVNFLITPHLVLQSPSRKAWHLRGGKMLALHHFLLVLRVAVKTKQTDSSSYPKVTSALSSMQSIQF